MKKFVFDILLLEVKFSEAEKLLLNSENVYKIKYQDFQISTFDQLNKEMLHDISNKCIVYCLWQGNDQNHLTPKYIGHAKNTISRQRIRAHLTKKNQATGAQLERIKESLFSKSFLGISYLEIEPNYMRTALEAWLIDKHYDKLEWNTNK